MNPDDDVVDSSLLYGGRSHNLHLHSLNVDGNGKKVMSQSRQTGRAI